MKFKMVSLAVSTLLFIVALSTQAATFAEGKNYLQLHAIPSKVIKQMPANKITVIEFFSYGCPACYHLEPDLEKWSQHLPHYVHFYRIPVIFDPSWQMYARAYYIAEQLGIAHKLNKDFFVAIQEKNQDLTTPQAMADFFSQHGVNKQKVTDLFNASPTLDIKMQQQHQLARDLLIFQIPTLVIDGKYKVDPSLAGADNQRLLNTVNELIAKEAKEKHLIK